MDLNNILEDLKNNRLPEKSKRILEEAQREFSEKGFYDASIDQIAAKAGVGKGTVYRHFIDKDTLFIAVMHFAFNNFTKILRKNIKKSDFKDMIRMLFKNYIDLAYDNIGLFSLIFHQVSKILSAQEKKEHFAIYFNDEIHFLDEIINIGTQQGYIDRDFDKENLAIFIWNCCSSLMKDAAIFNRKKEEAVKYSNMVIDIILKGLERNG